MKLFPIDCESLCCFCETTMFALGQDGKVRWYWAHNDLTLTFRRIGEGTIQLESSMPEVGTDQTHLIRIDMRTGAETH
jgi:hypothetical protein